MTGLFKNIFSILMPKKIKPCFRRFWDKMWWDTRWLQTMFIIFINISSIFIFKIIRNPIRIPEYFAPIRQNSNISRGRGEWSLIKYITSFSLFQIYCIVKIFFTKSILWNFTTLVIKWHNHFLGKLNLKITFINLWCFLFYFTAFEFKFGIMRLYWTNIHLF